MTTLWTTIDVSIHSIPFHSIPFPQVHHILTSIFQRVLFDSKGWCIDCIGTPYHPFSTLWKIQVPIMMIINYVVLLQCMYSMQVQLDPIDDAWKFQWNRVAGRHFGGQKYNIIFTLEQMENRSMWWLRSYFSVSPQSLQKKIQFDEHTYGGFPKWWYPTTMGFPTKNDHFGVFWGYHHLRKHPYSFKWVETFNYVFSRIWIAGVAGHFRRTKWSATKPRPRNHSTRYTGRGNRGDPGEPGFGKLLSIHNGETRIR